LGAHTHTHTRCDYNTRFAPVLEEKEKERIIIKKNMK
jgi:hypothetical protein